MANGEWVKTPGKQFWGYRVGTVSAFVWLDVEPVHHKDNTGYYEAQVIGLGSGGDHDLERLKRWAAKQVDESQDPVGAADVDRRITRKDFDSYVANAKIVGRSMCAADDEVPDAT